MNWAELLTGMDMSTVLASGVVAALAAAIVNGVTAWHRLRVEAQDRRVASQDEQLRDAVVDMLAAELRRFLHDRDVRDAVDEIVYSELERLTVRDPWVRLAEGKNERAEAAIEMENALGRVRLYSPALYEKATPLLTVEHHSVKADRDEATDRERADIMAEFLAAAQERLGIIDRDPSRGR